MIIINLRCLIKGHIFAPEMDKDYVVCLRCHKKLYGMMRGNTNNPPPDHWIYEKQCRFCYIPFGKKKCSKCETILYEWRRIKKNHELWNWKDELVYLYEKLCNYVIE